MLQIINGVVQDIRIRLDRICPRLDHGPLDQIDAIIMHQTGGSTAAGTLAKYENSPDDHSGAHFLLDRDGTMYQTMFTNRRCAHAAPIKARCLEERRCTKQDYEEFARIEKLTHSTDSRTHDRMLGIYESKKAYPSRFPYNNDAIGIEVVAAVLDPHTKAERYDGPSPEQTVFLHWFVRDLMQGLGLMDADVYRHPQVQKKNPTEASLLTW